MNSVGDRATFYDEEGNAYEIVHGKEFARFLGHYPEPLPERLKKTRPESIKGYEIVNGLNCAVRAVLANGKPTEGKEYVYIPYGLWVKAEWKLGAFLTVRELYNIEVAEPDPALVRIPEGYHVETTEPQ
jgi:hypothetical protein